MPRRAILWLGVSLLFACPARAGLYNTEDPGPPWSGRIASSDDFPVWPTANLPQFNYVMEQLRGVVVPQSDLRKRYDRRIADLETKNHAGELSTEDRVNLSAYYIRIQQDEKARAILEPVKGQSNFMVLSNLGTAYERMGQLDRAASYSEQALKAWPRLWPGLTTRQLNWLHRAENYHVRLLKLRQIEQARARGKQAEKVDALFPKVTFNRADGTYEINELEPAQLAELPDDNLLIVEQLLFWNPSDFRLHWLFGELLNAQGNLAAACEQFDLPWKVNYSPKELRDHRQKLIAARDLLFLLNREWGWLSVLPWGLTPRGATLEGGIGALANEIGPFGRAQLLSQLNKSNTPPQNTEQAAEPAALKPARNLMQDLRIIAVSFVAGCLVTLLVMFQFKETRRRLQGASAGKSEM